MKKILTIHNSHRFGFKHIIFVLIILIVTQILISFFQKKSLNDFLLKTQKWYQQDSAERLANLTSTSLELLVDNFYTLKIFNNVEEKRRIIQSFDIIFNQQLLQKNVQEVCLFFIRNNNDIIAIDNGKALFNFISNNFGEIESSYSHTNALKLFSDISNNFKKNEQIYSKIESNEIINIFVPFIPKGEFLGALYMKNKPDFSFLTDEFTSSLDASSFIYSSIILLGLLVIYYITSYSLKERDRVQEMFFIEREKHIKEQIEHEKESHFTKRIYHAHHKAEKVMGFIKEDLKKINGLSNNVVKYRVLKYSNFVSRVIYNMKWFETPLNTLRNIAFKTNINEVLEFIIDNIFLRITSKSEMFGFNLQLDTKIPIIHINEFAVWEVFEPLIQNSIDHSHDNKILITVKTEYDSVKKIIKITVSDDGNGILPNFLEENEKGIKKLFLENITSKPGENNSGYGCYISYEISKRCGWTIDAQNLQPKGSQFDIFIPVNS